MVSRQKGLIVNISSVGGVTYLQTPAYGIGKAAVGVLHRINAVCLSAKFEND